MLCSFVIASTSLAATVEERLPICIKQADSEIAVGTAIKEALTEADMIVTPSKVVEMMLHDEIYNQLVGKIKKAQQLQMNISEFYNFLSDNKGATTNEANALIAMLDESWSSNDLTLKSRYIAECVNGFDGNVATQTEVIERSRDMIATLRKEVSKLKGQLSYADNLEKDLRKEIAELKETISEQADAAAIQIQQLDDRIIELKEIIDSDLEASEMLEALTAIDQNDENKQPISLESKYADQLINQVKKCWVIDRGSMAAELSVLVGVSFKPDGKVEPNSVKLLQSSSQNSNLTNVAYQAARRAILRCQKGGYDLPATYYSAWRKMEILFSPN